LLVGGAGSDRSRPAWRQVYRSLDHGHAKNQCKNQQMVKKFPKEIEDFANTFVQLQEKRHIADYDPKAKFAKSGVQSDIIIAYVAIETFNSAKRADRRAFCVYVLLKERKI
jgi:hypothetical protein